MFDTGSYSLLFSFDLPGSKWQAILDQQLQQDICCLPLTEDMSFYVKHMALSTRQVSRIIQKEYGCTLSQLVTDKKLSAAELLVRTGDMPIEEIAVKSELGSPNYFYTLFKKRYGMSPLRYRKQHQL